MQRLLVSLSAGALLVAAAHAQCLAAPTGTSISGSMVGWNGGTFTPGGSVPDDGLGGPIAITAFASFPMAGAVGTLDQIWVGSNCEIYLTDSTLALTNATLPYALRLARDGWKAACHADPVLRKGLNVVEGKVVYPGVAEAFKLPLVDVAAVV